MTRLITYISNNQVKKENAIKRTNKNISALNQLSKKRVLPLFSEKALDQLKLREYVKVSYDRFYKIKNNIDINKGLTTRTIY